MPQKYPGQINAEAELFKVLITILDDQRSLKNNSAKNHRAAAAFQEYHSLTAFRNTFPRNTYCLGHSSP